MSRVLRYCLILALTFLASACGGELGLDVTVNEDGSGTVALTVSADDEFVEVFGSLQDAKIDDLLDAGWSFDALAAVDGEQVRLEKTFAKMEDLAGVIEELDGPEGLFRSVSLVRIDERDSVRYEFVMDLDLTRRVEDLSDSELTARLDGRPFGFDSAALEDMAGGSLESAVTINVHIDLVGEVLDVSQPLDTGEVIPVELVTVITDQVALDLRDTAQSKRNLAAIFGLVFLISTFAFWLFRRLRYEYVYEGEYGYEDVEQYEQEVPALAEIASPVEEEAVFEPGPNHVWVDGQGWVLDSEVEVVPTPQSSGVPAPSAEEIVVVGGSGSLAGEDDDGDPDEPEWPSRA